MKNKGGRPRLFESGHTKIISVTLPPDMVAEVRNLAYELDSSFSAMVRAALLAYLKENN